MADNLNTDELQRVFRGLGDLYKSMNDGSRTFGDYADAASKAAEIVESTTGKTKEALVQFGEQLGRSAIAYGQAMATGGEGTAKYSGAVTGASEAVGDLAAKLGVFGGIVGGIIKIFGGLAAASLKQNDVMMKSYRDLSEMGSIGGTLEKVMSDFNKVGLTSEEAEKFGNMLKKVAPELGAFGGSVSAGKDKMVGVIQGMIGPGNQIERGMARIGYGAEEMRDSTADYIKKQSNLGLAQGKTTDQLRTESVKYMTSLRELQEITGMQRDEAQKLMDEQQADARWAMTLRRIEAEEGPKAMERARTAMAAYSAEFGKQSANDLMEQVANKGAVVSEASARAQQSTLGEGYRNFRKVIDGTSDSTQMIINTSKAVSKNMGTLDGSIMASGKGIEGVSGSYEQMTGALRNSNRTYEDVQKSIAEKAKISGDRLDQNVDIEQKNRQFRIAADNALMAIGNQVVNMFQRLNDIMLTFAKTLAKVIDWMSSWIPGMAKTNFADQFKDKNDYQGDVNVAKNALADAEREKAKLQADVSRYAQDASGKTLQAAIDAAKKGAKDNFYFRNAETGEEVGDAVQAKLYEDEAKRLEELQKQIIKKDGTIDTEKIQQIEKAKLHTIEKKILEDQQKLQEAQKKLLEYSGGAGNGSEGPIAGSAGYMAKFNPGGMSGAGMAPAAPNANASGPPDLGGKKIEDIIKFGTGTGDISHFRSMDPNVANAFTAMAKEYFEKYGQQLQINSAYRTPEEQAAIAASGANGSNPVAKPGQSLHNYGRALDINSDQVKALLSSGLLQKYGFQPLQGDPPHIQYGARDGGVFDGPDTGYPVMLHGNEAVIPMPNLQDFTDSVKKENLNTIKGMDTGNQEPVIQKIESGINPEFMNSMMSMMADKFDEMIRHLDNSNSTQQQILTYTKA